MNTRGNVHTLECIKRKDLFVVLVKLENVSLDCFPKWQTLHIEGLKHEELEITLFHENTSNTSFPGWPSHLCHNEDCEADPNKAVGYFDRVNLEEDENR